MFLKRIKSKDGKKRTYWALVKSVRTARGPRHQVVSYLGELRAGEKSEWANLARIVNKRPIPRLPLFDIPETAEPVPETIEVRVGGARVERTRDFGNVYLALTLWRALELDQLLERIMPDGRGSIPWHIVATILSLARFCEPSSELHIADTWYQRTSLDDLMGVPPDRVNPDRLYRAHDHLLKHKDDIEKHLKQRYTTLFDAQYELLLYDVTSTYFEGEAKRNPQAKRGHSRDHRPDCKQVCIGLVVTREGLPVAYEVFEGNRHDSKTLQEIIEAMEERHGKARRIWVLDRGRHSRFKPAARDGQRRKAAIPARSRWTVHRGNAQSDAAIVRAGPPGARLDAGRGGYRSETTSRTRWGRDLHSLPQCRASRKGVKATRAGA